MSDVLRSEDIIALKARLELTWRKPVAIELSLDMLDYFRSISTYPTDSGVTRIYGLPIRIADGKMVARPVYEPLDNGVSPTP